MKGNRLGPDYVLGMYFSKYHFYDHPILQFYILVLLVRPFSSTDGQKTEADINVKLN